MKGYVLKGIFKTKNHKYNYEVHYRYFEKEHEKTLYKRVLHISKDEDAKEKAEMLKKAGFDIELFENDIYLKCNEDEQLSERFKKINNAKILNPVIRHMFIFWSIRFIAFLPTIIFF